MGFEKAQSIAAFNIAAALSFSATALLICSWISEDSKSNLVTFSASDFGLITDVDFVIHWKVAARKSSVKKIAAKNSAPSTVKKIMTFFVEWLKRFLLRIVPFAPCCQCLDATDSSTKRAVCQP